jgi:hypothetical protein
MGFWPFRRKSIRRHSHSGAANPRSEEGETMRDAGTQRDPERHNGSELAPSGPERRRSRRDSRGNRKSSRESKKLQRDPERRRTYSFSPGRNDSIRVPCDENRPPVPPLPTTLNGNGRAEPEKQKSSPTGQRLIRSSTQPLESIQDWQRTPTLHKRSAQDLSRRKSSKKRKEEHDREAEIKAMVSSMPARPATDADLAGRPMKRESRKLHSGLNRNLENPSSDVSLPLAESIHSSLSSDGEHQTSYKVSAFEVLAPRPTIRYSEHPRHIHPKEDSQLRKKRVSERVTNPEVTLKANKRIDDLADDLNAGELRELMERDQKRKEKKKLAEKIKVEKRVARRQEKQREDEAAAVRNGTPPPENMERGVLGREVVGLGIGTSAVVTSSKRKGSNASNNGRIKRPAESLREDSNANVPRPLGDFHRSPSLRTEQLTPESENSDPIIEIAQVGTVSKASLSPPSSPTTRGHHRGASSISQMMDLVQVEAPKPALPQPQPQPQSKPIPIPDRKPEASKQAFEDSARAPQSWTSFFKRNKKDKRGSTPSSFSNTSRDSMQNGLGPAIGYTPVRSTSNLPKRTMSKFREDLPELPISPPDSRVQSPEADVVPPIRTDYPEKKTGHSIEEPRVRYDTPTSGYRSLEVTRLRDETPTSGHRSEDVPSPEPTAVLSQSLASIDSEGSWLSGRKGGSKRGSTQLPSQQLRDSSSSINKKYKEYSESAEELGIAQDEYFSRLTPGPEERYKMQRQSTTMPSSDDEEGGSIASPAPSSSEKTKWGAVARTPTVVHREPRAKSREGLLNEYEFDSGDDTTGGVSAESKRKSYGFNPDLTEESGTGVRRAMSVDLGKAHARHISAGSARLLDLKPRNSVDAKRLSSG